VNPTKPILDYLTRFAFRLLYISTPNPRNVEAEPTYLPTQKWSGITLAQVQVQLIRAPLSTAPNPVTTPSSAANPPQIQIPNTHYQSAQTRPPAVHRHRPPLPPPARAAFKTRSCLAHQGVILAGDPSSSTPEVRLEAPQHLPDRDHVACHPHFHSYRSDNNLGVGRSGFAAYICLPSAVIATAV